MSNTPPVIGQDPWGADLNAYLATLDARLDAVEARPEYFFNSYAWQYSNQAPPPTGSQVRFDNANLSIATTAVFRLIDGDGADRKPVFQALVAGSFLRIQDWDVAANFHRFNVTGPATIGATDASLPVTWLSGSGTIPNAKINVSFVVPVVI